eukprot:TRINITY_DN944_c0_g1_i2.p1 TRINITY_DN944_c0_g1~~TRINITY_DN944_c0_g1_i2.p1  ORF type:complete len:276 (+),score=36.62 TRINITY_DN944_c0_g1_i2:264-1091(+)
MIALVSGWKYNSLGLLSSGFHSLFDTSAVVTSLIAIVVSKRKPTLEFSYGFERVEVLAAFSNASFLVFVALYLFFESCERLMEPFALETVGTITCVSLIGLIVHITGIVFFQNHIKMRTESAIHAHQMNIQSVVTRAVGDALACISVLISTLLIYAFSFYWADPLASSIISLFLIKNAIPIATSTGKILMQSVPVTIKDILDQNLRDITLIDGVVGLNQNQVNFWTYAPGVFVGSIHVRVTADADEDLVLKEVRSIFAPYLKHLTVQIDKWTGGV